MDHVHLDLLYKLKDQIKRELLLNSEPRQKKTGLKKKPRLQVDEQEKTAKFEQNFVRFKKKWKEILANIYASYRDTGVYDKIAYDLVQVFCIICSEYRIKDDDLYFALRCIIIPVTGSILDECEFNRSALELQKLRHYFLLKLLTIEIPDVIVQSTKPSEDDEPCHGESEESDSIDVGTQEPAQSPAVNSGESQPESQQRPKPKLNFSKITNFMVEVLFDALSTNTSLIKSSSFDLSCYRNHIHHILNSTYIANILIEFLDCLKHQIKHDTEHGFLNGVNAQYARGCLEKFDQRLIEDRTSLVTNHRWGIFESQLHSISSRITTLKYMLKQ